MICPFTRDAAIEQLAAFLPAAVLYARDRNHVRPGHPSVSRLSPAIRHRLITEEEVVAAVLAVHPFGRVEKFVQEVYWRRYWKSWLSLRPAVWREALEMDGLTDEDASAIRRISEARSGNAIIDHFAGELVTTGYLHNHARMWFAAWWVHQARLPWQAGAEFFLRHLLDGDPASNTLSWRWVAGLHTPGKTYLARRGNLETYLAPELLESLESGLEAFENPAPALPEVITKPPITRPELPVENILPSLKTGLWIHEEDLSVETSPLGQCGFAELVLTADTGTWERLGYPKAKTAWITAALEDAATRAGAHWKANVHLETRIPYGTALIRWAEAHDIRQVVAMRPEIGHLDDSLPQVRNACVAAGIRLVWIDRPVDIELRRFASGGFFQFWERLRKTRFNSKNRD